MGGASSKGATYSSYDDLVVDNYDVLRRQMEAFGLEPPPPPHGGLAPRAGRQPMRWPGKVEFALPMLHEHEDEQQQPFDAFSVMVLSAATARPVSHAIFLGDKISMGGTCWADGVPELTPEAVAAAAEEAEAAVAALSKAKAEQAVVDRVFAVDRQQQEQEREAALAALAAALGDGGLSSAPLGEDEREALREAGRQAREAADAQLAARTAASDAELAGMGREDRERWFEEHTRADDDTPREQSFDDEWAALPPEVLAMVAEMQAR